MSSLLDVLVLDFDRTLFNTDEYFTWVVDLLESDFGVPRVVALRDFPKYKHVNFNLQYYDFFAHIGAMGLDLDQVEQTIIRKLQGRGLYSDVAGILAGLPDSLECIVLTYGDPRHQRLKYTVSGLQLPMHISPGQKGEWLQKHYGDKRGLMVDDRIIYDLPSEFAYEQVDRTAKNPQAYHNLSFVESYL